MSRGRRPIDITGNRYGTWTVLEPARSASGKWVWRCRCDCGVEGLVRGWKLRNGHATGCQACGRAKAGLTNRRHGHSRKGRPSPVYRIWRAMIERCHRAEATSYPRYGARGISVCERWKNDFAAFLADMGDRPAPDYTLERINNDGNYEPANCRWATRSEQARNRRTNRRVTAFGATLTLAGWAERTGVPLSVISARLRRGWAPADAVATPVGAGRARAL